MTGERTGTGPAPLTLTRQQAIALAFLERGRDASRGEFDPHGYVISEETFYDSEIHQAAVHWRTARALERRGIVRLANWDPEYGHELWLT